VRAAGFPVPPLDLPHYHGVGVTTESAGATAGAPARQAAPGTDAAGIKEVTGA
jgi:hypothetical protein